MSATEQPPRVRSDDVLKEGFSPAPQAHIQQRELADPEGADNSNSLSVSGWSYILKVLLYATALPNTAEKMEIAIRIANGFQAIARAPTSNGWIHDAFNANRYAESAIRARMDKTNVDVVIADGNPDVISMKWSIYFPSAGQSEDSISDEDVHAGIDAIRQMAKRVHAALQGE